jgi:hypothetical protein
MFRNPIFHNCTFKCMEIIGDIGECQANGLSRAGFEGIEKFYGSLIVCENPYISFDKVIRLAYLKVFLCSFNNTM